MQLLRQSEYITAIPGTSRSLPNPERGVLAILRSLAPRRHLTRQEADYIGEVQAYRLLDLAGLREAPVPSSLIQELPRLAVRSNEDLPVSGSTHWLNGRWIITINGSEPPTRQRFTLAHELKHVIDHRHRDVLYAETPGLPADIQGEYAADNFAACLLMPKRWVKRAWADGLQQISELSKLFDVSPQAMRVRLEHLGFLRAAGRHDQRQNDLRLPAYQRFRRPVGGLLR
jgi:hypothetical protein